MNVVGVIPARMAATRFPNKPLAPILGIPMIGHVYFRSTLATRLDSVYVATCDAEIQSYCQSIGAPCVMTAVSHQRASDRAAEAVERIEAETGRAVDAVMMIQGDEPLLDPSVLDRCIEEVERHPEAPVVNLMENIPDDRDFESQNVVKVVLRPDGSVLYFSREPIPSRRLARGAVPRIKQLGLIAFRREFLRTYAALAPTDLEKIESVDMLRVLEHGYTIRAVLVEARSIGVDTPADLDRAAELMAADTLFPQYRQTAVTTR